MKHSSDHKKQAMETWSGECIEGECDHIPEDDQGNYAMEDCPSSVVDCCVECTTRDRPELFEDWDGYVMTWQMAEEGKGVW